MRGEDFKKEEGRERKEGKTVAPSRGILQDNGMYKLIMFLPLHWLRVKLTPNFDLP